MYVCIKLQNAVTQIWIKISFRSDQSSGNILLGNEADEVVGSITRIRPLSIFVCFFLTQWGEINRPTHTHPRGKFSRLVRFGSKPALKPSDRRSQIANPRATSREDCPHSPQGRTNRSQVACNFSPPCQWKLDTNTDIKKKLCYWQNYPNKSIL